MNINMMRFVGARNQMTFISMVEKIVASVFWGCNYEKLSNSFGILVLATSG
jgi:hypothetical protein